MIGLDTEADEQAINADYHRRTDANRRAKMARAAADAIAVPADTPDEPVSVAALVQRIRDAEAHNRELENERRRREAMERDITDAEQARG